MSGDGLHNLPEMSDLDMIRAVIDGMPVLEETGGQLSTDTTEQTLYVNDEPAGNYRPICLKVDCSDQAIGETMTLRVYYRIAPTGGLLLHDTQEYTDAVAPPKVNIDLDPTRYGIHVTLQSDTLKRLYDWEVFYEV